MAGAACLVGAFSFLTRAEAIGLSDGPFACRGLSMVSRFRSLVVATVLSAAASGGVLAGASTSNIQYTPDPALKTASRADLETRVRRSCAATQARIQSRPEAELDRPCACYASRTVRSLDKVELENYRNRGVFDDTTRIKALANLDRCNLKRPG
jgi:hypothetical protein